MSRTFLCAVLLFCTLSWFGCKTSSGEKAKQRKNAVVQTVRRIVFVRHKESGLCFAIVHQSMQGFMATVPCDKVEKLLVNR